MHAELTLGVSLQYDPCHLYQIRVLAVAMERYGVLRFLLYDHLIIYACTYVGGVSTLSSLVIAIATEVKC